MTTVDYGVYGAKRQSVRKGNPRNFIAKVLEKNPDISDEDLREKVKLAILKNEDYLDAIIEYWVAGERRNLTRRPPPSPQEREEAAEQRQTTVTEMAERVKAHVEKKLLDMMIPVYDKPLRECTFGQIAKLGGRFTSLSGGGKPNEKVGKLSETAVKKLFR